MRFYKTIKLFLFFFIWVNLLLSQNYPSKNYTAANELPNNTVRSLLVDSNNVLWIGTENGVVKKENDVLTSFFEEDGLALNSCWAIAEDKDHKLWFGSYGEGLSVYNGTDFKVISEKQGLIHNEITKLLARGDKMYVGTSNGISIVDINSLEVISLKNPDDENLFRVQDFFEYKNAIYIATYNSGIFKIDNKNGRPSLAEVNDHKFLYSVYVENDSIYSSEKGYFTKTEIENYLNQSDTASVEKYGHSIIWDYVKCTDDRVFAAAWGIYENNGGIYQIDGDRFISRAADFNINSKEVISLAYDHNFKKLYVGTKDEGYFEVNLDSQIKFNKVEGKEILGFANTNITSATLLNDAILIKSSNSEKKISLQQLKEWEEDYLNSTSLPLPKHENNFYELDYSTEAKNISFYDIKASQGVYWINTNIGIFALTASGKLDRYLPVHTEEINFTTDNKLIETNPYGGVRVYKDLDNFKYQAFEKEDPQTPTMIVSSLKTRDKTYFLSVFSGLYIWEKNQFKSYLQDGVWEEKKLRHITTLGNDLAISNEFGDVYIVNDEKSFQVLKKITRAKIQGNSIAFLENYKGTLIIGTEKGITLYKKARFIFLDKEQGLLQPLLSAEVKENTLKVGSENGYFSIDLDEVTHPEPSICKIEFKELSVNNNKFPLSLLANPEKIRLPYNHNTILLKYGTNSHPYPHKLKYQYRLKPGEKWSQPTMKPEIFLPFLPSDKYEVMVKVLDESTGFSYTHQLVTLTILLPFWKTWWFILMVSAIVFILFYGFYRYQIIQTTRFEVQKRVIQKRFEETKMEALLAQMNPHFIFNAMNSIQYYIMNSDIDNATIFLGDFAKLIRLNLDYCTKPTILLSEEIEYLQSYIRVENTRFNNKITVAMEIDPAIDTYAVEIPTMILQTFIENVFVHAFPASITNPTLKVSFKLLSEDLLECKIEDNGTGISNNASNKLHESKGVSLVKERLILLGNDVEEAIQIISTKNKGTSITLKLKI